MNPFDILDNKTVQEIAMAVNPGLGLGIATLAKLDDTVEKAKGGDIVAIETVKAIKAQSDVGDPRAKQAVRTMAVMSKAQDRKKRKRGLYARGMAVGHDPYSIGQVTDHRGGTTTTYYRPPTSGTSPYTRFFTNAAAPTPLGARPGTTSTAPLGTGTGIRRPVATPAPAPATAQDPYGQGAYPQYPQDPYGGYGGGYGGYPQYPYPPSPVPTPYPASDPYGMYSPYYGGLPGLPYGYGMEEPVVDRGGYQQYDPNTDSFYSSNQKQVYDETTGMFYPTAQANPYGF